MPDIKLIPVTSSQIKAIGYDVDARTLAIEFNSGGLYHYANFTHEDWIQLKEAESKGKHFYKYIKYNTEKYPYKKQK